MGETVQNSLTQVPERPVERANYFLSVTLQNIRCFGPEPQTLRLSHDLARPARWTIVLGENGVGKTTLLQVIAGFEAIAYHPFGMSDNGYDVPRCFLYFQTDFSMELLRNPSADALVGATLASSPSIETMVGTD